MQMRLRPKLFAICACVSAIIGLAAFLVWALEDRSSVDAQALQQSPPMVVEPKSAVDAQPEVAPRDSRPNATEPLAATPTPPHDPAWDDPVTGPILRKALTVDMEKVNRETAIAQQERLLELARVASQPLEDTVQEVIAAGPNTTISVLQLSRPEEVANDYGRRPPWSGLLGVAESGTLEDKKALAQLIQEYYADTFAELPAYQSDGEWYQTKLMPGGAECSPCS